MDPVQKSVFFFQFSSGLADHFGVLAVRAFDERSALKLAKRAYPHGTTRHHRYGEFRLLTDSELDDLGIDTNVKFGGRANLKRVLFAGATILLLKRA